jgi:hypothetical protein
MLGLRGTKRKPQSVRLQMTLSISSCLFRFAACSFGWWLMAGADLLWEKSIAG